jgi:hypothetical protein
MHGRSWLMAGLVMMVAALAACSSPGEPFAYRDLKFSASPSAFPSQPATTPAVTIGFSLRNTWNQPLSAVAWELRDTTDALNVTVVASGTADIAAFASSTQSVPLPALTPAGTRTYVAVVDPANGVAEEDEGNNTSAVLTVLVADQDISFGTPAPAITWPSAGTAPLTTDPLTLTFAIQDTVNAAQPAPTAIPVPYSITVNGAAVVPTSATHASPATVDPAGTNPLSVTVTLPPTGSAGTFIYIITLSPADGDDNATGNNTATVVVGIPASI